MELAAENMELAGTLESLYYQAMAAGTADGLPTVKRLLSELRSNYAVFQENNSKLQAYASSLKKESYFKEDVFSKITTLVEAALTKLEVLVQKLQDQSGKIDVRSPSIGKKMELPKEQSHKNGGLIRRFQYALSDLNEKMEALKLKRESFETVKQAKDTAEKIFYEYIDKFEDDELVNSFYSLKDEYNEIPADVKMKKDAAEENLHYTLPSIDIPMFDGEYSKWNTFKELFEQLVVQKSIPNVQKMCILKTKLKGEAASCIANLPSTTTNFDVAWKILNEEFTNKRRIANFHFKRILDAPCITESATSVKLFQRTIRESLQALKTLNLSAEKLLQAFMNFVLVRKMDENLRLKYEGTLENSKEIQEVDSLVDFLNHEYFVLEAVDKKEKYEPKPETNNEVAKVRASSSQASKCFMGCNVTHYLNQCSKFRKLNINEKWNVVKTHKLCTKCFNSGHTHKNCKMMNCKICNSTHHTFLHRPDQKSAIVSALSEANADKYVLLSTAKVEVKNFRGEFVEARALLDSGSQVSLITKSFKNALKLKTKNLMSTIEGIGSKKADVNERINVLIKSKTSPFSTNIDLLVVPKIVSELPAQKIIKGETPKKIRLADPQFDIPAKVDLLLGAELFYILIKEGQIKCKEEYTLQNSSLGWLACGTAKIKNNSSYCGMLTYGEESLNNQLKKFWELEEIQPQENKQSAEEKLCEKHFYRTVKRESDGRFIVSLPIKKKTERLGESAFQAERRFYSLERKLEKNETLKNQYSDFMRQYLELGHMDEVKDTEKINPKYYLPHHCVLKPDSSTTKLRVVFDASCKTTTNVSLNDILCTGPRLQEEIFNILLRFRKHRYVFSADIEKMYRQIWMTEKDQKYQLILWRWNKEEELKTYTLKTVTYGTSSAPYLAVKCLQKSAELVENIYPKAAEIIKSDFYMDDLMTGGDNLAELQQLKQQIVKALGNCGFTLRKWCANEEQLLEGIPDKDREVQLNIDMDNISEVKALGVAWFPTTDELMIKCKWDMEGKTTKRSILSDISKLFDPLGLVNPVIVTTKILLQDLWKSKTDWDEKVSDEILHKWNKIKTDLPKLNQLKISRRVICNNPKRIELHGFCDASMSAYGAVIYVRSFNEIGEILVSIAAAKSRVAPTKVVTLPRLELCAAVLLIELAKKVVESLKLKFDDIFYYSDSEIVLSWLKLDPAVLQIFVSNRVSFIQSNCNVKNFRHIKSKENPADLISRGMLAREIINNKLWFNGPEFLSEMGNIEENTSEIKIQNIPEVKKTKIVAITVVHESMWERINDKSDFKFLQNVVANVIKCRDIFMKKPIKTRMEYKEEALSTLVSELQRRYFEKDRKCLVEKRALPGNSKISTLSPIIDDNGLIRVGGRLQNSNLNRDAKHPLLLPSNERWVLLLMEYLHKKHLHIGPQGLLSIVRQKFWPLRGRQLTKKVVGRCYRCFRVNPRPLHQMMGNLPADRLLGIRPFLNVGVDFLGPVSIHHKIRGKKVDKAYVCVFVCFATKAVHLEVVSDLSSAAFIGALKRFVARRSCPQKVYSDNATNFVGAANSLNEVYKLFKEKELTDMIESFCAERNINWVFIPARSPHVGGLWEAAVKSVKKHFYRTIEGIMTFEELSTLITQIEAILNSRPLTPLSDDPNDFQVLTPGHFLIGEPIMTLVDAVNNQCYRGIKDHWKAVERSSQRFWERWSTEYLSELQKRYKWKNPSSNIKEGTLVMLKEDNVAPMNWRRGRVLKTILGNDGKCRMVDVRTSTGVSKRSIHNVCPFPTEEEKNDIPQIEKENKPSTDSKIGLRKSTRIKNCSLLTLLLCIAFVVPNVNCQAKINKLKDKSGIFFESQGTVGLTTASWNLILHANLTDYWVYQQKLKSSFDNLLSMNAATNGSDMIKATIEQLHEKFDRIMRNHDIILHNTVEPSKRVRRSPLAFVGSVLHAVFGVMDEEHAQMLQNQIKRSRINEEYLLELQKNHSSFEDITEKIVKKQNEVIWRNFDKITKEMYKINTAINQELDESMLMNSVTSCFIAMESFEMLQRDIIEIIWNSKGNFMERVLPFKRFQQQIMTIAISIAENVQLPDTNPIELARVSQVTTRTTKELLLFKIRIPLINKERLEAFAVYPYPTMHDGYFVSIKPTYQYILWDSRRTMYYGVSTDKLYHCEKMNRMILCPQTQPLFNANIGDKCEVEMFLKKRTMPQTCEINVMQPRNMWVQLHTPNTWLYSTMEETSATVTCGNNLTEVNLTDQGVVQLKAGCHLQTAEVNLWAYEEFTTDVNYFLPTLNLSGQLPPLRHIEIKGELESFKIPTIPKQKTILGFPISENVDYNDIIHYGMSATNLILFVAGAVIVFLALKKLCGATNHVLPVSGFGFGR